MNGALLAALVVVALIVVAVVLKKRAAQNKTAALPPTESAAETVKPEAPPTAPEMAAPLVPPAGPAAGEPAAQPATEQAPLLVEQTEEPGEQQPESAAAVEEDLALVDPETASGLIETADPLELADLEAVEVETSEDEVMVGETIPSTLEPEPSLLEVMETAEQPPAPGPLEEQGAPLAAAESTVAPVLEAEESPVAEQPVPEALATAGEAVELPDLIVEPAPAAEMPLPAIRLTLETYSARLNALEEQRRLLLAQAMHRREDDLRDRLQRELVLMNDKLALLADSYVEEIARYQQVLEILDHLDCEAAAVDLANASEQLRAGEPEVAEALLAALSNRPIAQAARAAYGSGLLAECRIDLHTAMERYRRAVEQEPNNPNYLQAAGRTARSLYKYKEALPWLESFVRLSGAARKNDALDLALAQRELAYTYVLSGHYQKAGPLYKESMTVLARKLGQDHPEMAISWRQLGEFQETMGEYDKAVSLYQKALEILEKKRGPEHPTLAHILDKLAALCMELEMEKQAVPLYERLVRIREKALRPTHPQLAMSLNNLAESYRLQGQYPEAEACYRKSLAINEAVHGPEHPSVAAILQELAKLCTSQRKPEEAKQYQDRAAAIFQKSVEAAEKSTGKEALTLEL